MNVRRAFAVLGLVLSAVVVMADTPTTSTDHAADLKALKSLVETLAAKPDEKTQPKTLADVADKALDLTSTAVSKMAGQLETVAPEVWKMFVLQQYAKAASNCIATGGLTGLALTIWLLLRKNWPSPRDSDNEIPHTIFTKFIPAIATIVMSIFFICSISDAVVVLINPRYYALKDIIHVLLSPGSL